MLVKALRLLVHCLLVIFLVQLLLGFLLFRALPAQAIRLNMEWAPRPAVVAPRAVAAIERVSGCAVSRLEGDQAVFVASLDCGAGSPPRPIFPLDLECDAYDLKDGYGTLECRPYP